MLDVLLGQKLHNTAVVVTRYFGGVLLGTGGLVRAYQKAVLEGLANSVIIEKTAGYQLKITTDYTGIGKLQYLAASEGLHIINTDYTDIVVADVLTDELSKDSFIKKLTEATNGGISVEESDKIYFAIVDSEPVIFES